jgi:outer membrane protein OmpA-like peptidoglycan-associated protein
MKSLHLFTLGLLFGFSARANLIGTDYQNFNPTYSSLDFVTVHSSEILRPCLCNIGLFFNYAKNTLTYSESYIAAGGGGITDLKGTRTKDSMTSADVLIGFGISENFDLGLALPFVVTAKNDDPYGVSYFDKFGLTEFRPSAKYRFFGDQTGGMAAVLSLNIDQIKDNPFAGSKPGPTINLEFVGDTTVGESTKLGFNIGYRKRNPGDRIISPSTGEAPPFVPYKDSVIYSVAAAMAVPVIKSDVIFEIKGGTPISSDVNQDTKRTQQGLEWGVGLRHDFSESLHFHGGLGTKLAEAQASPDYRIHAGLNLNFGTPCDQKQVDRIEPRYEPEQTVVAQLPRAVITNVPVGESDNVDIEAVISAVDPVTYSGYKYKLGTTSEINCRDEGGYSEEMLGESVLYANIKDLPDGSVTLCALAKNTDSVWQPASDPTSAQWIKYSTKTTTTKTLQVVQKEGYELFRLSAEVLFDFDKDEVRDAARDDLDRIAKYLRQKPFKQVLIEGHTDSKGTDKYNLDLSDRRAKQVKNWLVTNYRFEASQFKSIGKGEKFPVATNKTDDGRQQNRRVEFKVFR